LGEGVVSVDYSMRAVAGERA